MADEKPPPDFMSALGTEYFVLQSTASSTISESGSRVSIYLSSLASGLVALGFSSASPRAFASLAFTVLPTVFVLGWFTCVLGGATIALLCDLAFKAPLPAAASIGVVVGLALLALSLHYEHRRLTPVVLTSYAATVMTGDRPGVT
jgi:hypothetical protein